MPSHSMKTAYKNFIIFDGVTLCVIFLFKKKKKEKEDFQVLEVFYWFMVYAAEICIIHKINDRLFHFVFKSRLL